MNFYYEAAKVLERLDAKKGSIKGLVSSLPEKSRKRSAALVIETLKYKDALTSIIESSALLKHERKHLSSHHLTLLLIHDLLFTRGGIQASDGPTKQAVLRHKTRLQAELVKLKVKRGATSNQELASQGDSRAAQIPRYVRVNTMRWSTEEAINYLTSKGFFKTTSPFEAKTSFVLDEHVHDLLAFHPKATFHDDAAYKVGKLILQDKASCFPAFVLSPPSNPRTVVLDATAAPGNKTTHLSAIMKNQGKILAFERDRGRFATLQCMVAKAGCENIEASNTDFLSTDPMDVRYAEVSHILLDPSCSGSGIVNRLDYLLNTEEENDGEQNVRLEKLAAFQLTMIRHAMKFPHATRIVYSTCSIHAIENEQVVAQALDSEEAHARGFTLAPRAQILPAWKRRGLANEMGKYSALSESMVRCFPGEDGTNGFFVSCFVRKPSTRVGAQNSKRKADGDLDVDGSSDEIGIADVGETKKARKKKKKRKAPAANDPTS
ncbi:S-adenosyl-L-methionine-dependent methyltransferase [Ramaria rubella]|nr:S-adenosyl-L-methionine-dependent methyltransferase [Ramaria rubella]